MTLMFPALIGSQRSTMQMQKSLRHDAACEASDQLLTIDTVIQMARWQWALETDAGEYIAGMAIVPDTTRRGWFCAFHGTALSNAVQLRPMIRMFNLLSQARVFDELRAWVLSDDAVAIRFAERFKFVYDCGPATGFSPTGADMTLYLWRHHEQSFRRRRGQGVQNTASADPQNHPKIQ